MDRVRAPRWWSAAVLTGALTATGAVVVLLHSPAPVEPDAMQEHVHSQPGHITPRFVPVAVNGPGALETSSWKVTTDSQETVKANNPATNVLDGNSGTIWHSRWDPAPAAPLPHQIVIDMQVTNRISGLSYLPRQDGSRNGNIGQYRVEVSATGSTYTQVATGTFADDATRKNVQFTSVSTRFVRFTALTEAGNRGPWSSAAEVALLSGFDPTLPRTGWTATADSESTANGQQLAGNVLDGNYATIWRTAYDPPPAAPLPHWIKIDMKATTRVSGLSYLPRQDGSRNGNIGQYRVETSTDGTNWGTPVATGTFLDVPTSQTVTFNAVSARYVRLTALTEAGNRGPWSSAAEINLLGPATSVAATRGVWGNPIGFPLVPAAATVLPNGKILTWASRVATNYGGGGQTVTAIYDPATGVVTQATITSTGHDMFCPGISVLPDGRVMVTGGDDSQKTTLYNPSNNTWATGPLMTIGRGYQATVTLSTGEVFNIGGSWSGGRGNKNGEIWNAATGWRALPGAPVAPMLTADAGGIFRQDNHGWLFAWSNGSVFQAGPSKAMNWYFTAGSGSTTPAGTRGADTDAMDGNAVMYDAGKILTVGGSPNYENSNATANAHVITLNGTGTPTVRKVASMANARAFANSVVLPDGKVAVFGGQNFAVPFSDNTAVLNAEMWDPATEKFTTLAAAAIPRTYHSVALLMTDGRVFTGGGGLCGSCTTNHLDGEIFTPPYLFNADGTPATRPTITSAPATAANGATITVTTPQAISKFAIVRLGSATHSVDTDQRRIALTPTAVTGGYTVTIPADKGVAVPGNYMLFALNANGVPSVAKIIRIG